MFICKSSSYIMLYAEHDIIQLLNIIWFM